MKEFYQVLLGGIRSFFFQGIISWVGLGGWGKEGGIPFFSLFFPFS
jgi:hypothetical protein